ncbi:MAG: outer membrane protein assembly factor BamA [Flavobacteriales bacterium]|nr:outer membrane protein assembly factor BamA [Flavobacteriales bacterium]
MKKLLSLFTLLFISFTISSQIILGGESDFKTPKEYVIGGISVIGAETTDVQAIKLFSGLSVGEKITVPGEKISAAIRNLWKQDLFANVEVFSADVRGEDIFLAIKVTERERLSRYGFKGISKSDVESLREQLTLVRGKIINEDLIARAKNTVRNYYIAKGYLNTTVRTEQWKDTIAQNAFGDVLDFYVKKGNKIKINDISFLGIEAFSDVKLKRTMSNTKEKKWYRVFKRSKFTEGNFKEDKQSLIAMFNKNGYRNVKILSDTIWDHDEETINIRLSILEDKQFYFRDISWLGNSIYTDDQLNQRLGIAYGEIYNETKLQQRLFQSPTGGDVSSLYLDNGYLSFNATPVEVQVDGDSIDIEVRIYEGKQYRIRNVTIAGNTITNDHVIMREIRTKPGDLFNRSAIIRTQRELSNLGYFDPEQFGVNPKQNPQDGTVDIEYTVVERPSDQIELSGGWGAGRVVGTLGLSFNNFSLRNMFTKGAWRPVPKGDGQRLSIRAQSNGQFYQAYTLSFVEPWLGGKKPNSFSVSLQHSVQTNGVSKNLNTSDGTIPNPDRRDLSITGLTVGFGQRWQRPDDWFVFRAAAAYQYYDLNNFGNVFTFASGVSNNASIQLSLSRNSVSAPIFPTYGSDVSLSLKATLPYSALFSPNKDFANATDQEKFKWLEYHKWKFTSAWYTTLAGSGDDSYSDKASRSLVLYAKTGHGYLGHYNRDIGDSPFERFYLGGSALTGFQLDGREIIALRGYDDNSISPTTGSTFISKYTTELRYPLSLNPNATIYMLGFAEAGNTWSNFDSYNPFELNKSAGFGMRIFLPMFGLLGLDYGWRFDDIPTNLGMPRSQFHFTIGTNLGEL